MVRSRLLAVVLGSAVWIVSGVAFEPAPAHACGGFFCGNQPVDQTAERIVFAANEDGTVTMVVQISYRGDAANFAWVLPLGTVPDAESLDVFPQAALSALDANSGPQFNYPEDCAYPPFAAGGVDAAEGDKTRGGVTVHIRAEVGPYDVAVIESTDPTALVDWLHANGFGVNAAMEPYIRIYTAEGMKFLALRLQPDAEVTDIQPFKFTMPGSTPSIPLRLTALASEPEMGIVVMILGDMRFGPANWPELDVDESELVWSPYTWPMTTNWAPLVARAADEAGGRGFIVESAGSTEPYLQLLRDSTPSDPDQIAARDALLELMGPHPYMTRLYTRLSPEEMTSDPIFRRTAGGDVPRTRTLPRYVDGVDMCGYTGTPVMPSPCAFAACGAGGMCREAAVNVGGTIQTVAGCACVPGATARTTLDPSGQPAVTCQDTRMSFLNPGDRAPDGSLLPDPCVGYDCGEGGECIAINMTPTCRCDTGLVAIGGVLGDGARTTRCTTPFTSIPREFYWRRLPELPPDLPGGRPTEMTTTTTREAGGCSVHTGGAASSKPWGALVAVVGLLLAVRRRRGRGAAR